MPWTAKDAQKHKKGLSDSQAEKWAEIANGALETCKKNPELAEGAGFDSCDGYAIATASSKVG